MPISRSNTLRGKSRSPAPPPLPPNSIQTSQRPFLPPSHYAAAGGFNVRSPIVQVEQTISDPKKRRLKPNLKHNYARNQTENHPGPSDSDSLISIDNALPISMKRQSSRSELTGIEAQLLPSLRDTIDRMTGAPSRASSPYRTGVGNVDSATRGKTNTSRSSPELKTALSERMRSEAKPSNDSNSFPYPTPAIGEGAVTPISSQFYSDPVNPIMGSLPLRSKTPAKSALKTSLRSPVPNPPMPMALSVNSPPMSGSSLRNMKSLLTRKCSGTLRSPFTNAKPSSEGMHHDNRKPGGVSTPTPPVLPGPDSATKTDQLYSESESPQFRRFSTKKIFQSNIPRPRTRHYHNEAPEHGNLDDSDLDRRYDNEQRDRRKLTVANAEVPMSVSSESDIESRINHDLRNTIAGARIPRKRESLYPIGLGLSMRKQTSEPREFGQSHSRETEIQLHDFHPVSREKSLRFSLPPSESAGSSYSDELSNYRPESYRYSGTDTPDGELATNATQPRRFEDSRYIDKPSNAQTRRSSPSAVYEASTDEETESDREGYSVWYKKPNEKHPSPNRKPTLPPTHGQESESFVPVASPRQQTSRRRRESPSPRNSEGFAPNLRELIKSRHSFTRLACETAPISSQATPRQRHVDPLEPSSAQQPRVSSPLKDSDHHRHQDYYKEDKESFARTPASAIIDDYRSAAARERMAFGIPPSESDEAISAQEQGQQLFSEDSNMSSINASLWQEESENMSEEAESIFRALNYPKSVAEQQNSKDAFYDSTPRLSVISPTLSSPSACDERAPNRSRSEEPLDENNNLIRTREGVIQEIFETEEELIRHLHTCMSTFVLPLRVHNSRSWISGVPANIAKLLDWFNDIVNLHEQIYESLCSARDTMSPATDRVSESLRCFVLKFEVYQPYLVRLADVSEDIMKLIDDPQSDFGQFVGIQQRLPECEGWTFERFLMLPVNRLAAYQVMFARLLDLTPKSHQDYLSTFSLSRSTDMVIRVMTEVKIREDEYNLLKLFSSRIQGIPFSKGLATRERRLLHSGPLDLILSGLPDVLDPPSRIGPQPHASESKRADRSSKLLDTINTSSSVFERADSEKSASSFDGIASGKGPVATSTPVKSSWFSRLPLRRRPQPKPLLLPVSEPQAKGTGKATPMLNSLKTVSVHVFVFSDLVLLAQPSQTHDDKPRWILSTDLGLFRPLSIAHIQRFNQEGTVLSLEAITLDVNSLNDNTDFKTTSFRTVDLLMPTSTPSENDAIDHCIIDEVSEPWILAFRQCSKATLRKLTFLGLGTQHELCFNSDRTLDTFLAVSTLVGSGQPIPRSPSGHFPDKLHDQGEDLLGDERQERGWWSLRYQQVFREFQRQDSVLSDDDPEETI
ncbi:RhoGEF domain-containing protein gxcJ [Psilocybe cubensis]|uniref:DH domain-containing protein n=2 Tax=Psilocybe cubensis TaxID=181762 RepID=A0A8H7XRE9_PSICU|nr:RhoGEF domain-containing protein gxcJ [Psilocybe cubensis]KAH9475165.1 RhoGEF domain-containing protein gxcJ [Psilocybe cubensis]